MVGSLVDIISDVIVVHNSGLLKFGVLIGVMEGKAMSFIVNPSINRTIYKSTDRSENSLGG